MTTGEWLQLRASVAPVAAAGSGWDPWRGATCWFTNGEAVDATFEWRSSAAAVVTVDEDGFVTARRDGSATITAHATSHDLFSSLAVWVPD
jgi:hypothetical protein